MYCMWVEQWLKVLFPDEKIEEMSFADVGKDRNSATFAQLQDFYKTHEVIDSLDECIQGVQYKENVT